MQTVLLEQNILQHATGINREEVNLNMHIYSAKYIGIYSIMRIYEKLSVK